MVTKKISYLLKKGKKYIYNVSWLFLEKILRMTVGLSVGVWVARYLGPNDFGLLSYAQSFVALFTIFATLGLDSIVIKELVKGDKEVNIIMGTAFKLKLLGSLIVIIILFIAVKLTTNNEFENLLIFIISGSIVFQSFNVIDFYFQSKVLSKFVVFANTFSLLFVTAIKVVFIVYEAPLIYFAFTSILDNIIIALGLLYFYRRESKPQKRFKFENKLAAEMLRQSWPLVLSGLKNFSGDLLLYTMQQQLKLHIYVFFLVAR